MSDNQPLPPPPLPLHSASSSIQPLPPKLPCGDLLARREDYINICVPLYNASMNGDWEAANMILSRRTDLVRFSITENHETALHVAARAQNTKFVKELVKLMDRDDLELQNKYGNTTLCLTALSGNKELTEFLVNQNRELLSIPGGGSKEQMPLYMAALSGDHDTVKYLYENSEKMTGSYWTLQNQGEVLLRCVESDLFDIALEMLEDNLELARTDGVLGVLARKPHAFKDRDVNFFWRAIKCFGVYVEVEEETEAMNLLQIIWKYIMRMPKSEIDGLLRGPADPMESDEKGKMILKDEQSYSSRVIFIAAQMGNTKFLVELIRQCPDLIWKRNDDDQSIFHVAVSHRHESIYNLLHEIGSMRYRLTTLQDREKNNMLHLVGKNQENNRIQDISGDVFQMQRELLWFKEVEAMLPYSCRESKNVAGKTPRQLFIENHKDLVFKSEKWIRETASTYMVVAILIAGIVCTAANAIPREYNETTGYTMFTRRKIFIAFAILDVTSLFFSSISFLLFTSTLSSRYYEQDFIESFAQKLMIGLTTTFLSIITMMVAFSLGFFVPYHNNQIWLQIIVSLVAVGTFILHAKLQGLLLVDLYHSIHGSRHIFKPKKRILYVQNSKF